MNKNEILIMNDIRLGFKLDNALMQVYIYDVFNSKIIPDSKKILKTVNSNIAKDIEKHFEIDIKEYSVNIDDSSPREMNDEDRKYIKEDNIFKYMFVTMFVWSSYTLLTPSEDPDIAKVDNFFGYLSIVVSFIVVGFITGRQRDKKKQIKRYIKFNISTSPIPSKDECIDILEEKVSQLIKEKETNKES